MTAREHEPGQAPPVGWYLYTAFFRYADGSDEELDIDADGRGSASRFAEGWADENLKPGWSLARLEQRGPGFFL